MSLKEGVTLSDLRALGRLVDAEFVHADCEGALYNLLNTDYGPDRWTMLRAPVWCGSQLVALVVKPRRDDEPEGRTVEAVGKD